MRVTRRSLRVEQSLFSWVDKGVEAVREIPRGWGTLGNLADDLKLAEEYQVLGTMFPMATGRLGYPGGRQSRKKPTE